MILKSIHNYRSYGPDNFGQTHIGTVIVTIMSRSPQAGSTKSGNNLEIDIEVFFFFGERSKFISSSGTIGNIFTSGEATIENITDGVHELNKFRSFTEKNQKFCLFHAFNPFWEKLYQNPVQFFSTIPRGVPLPHINAITI